MTRSEHRSTPQSTRLTEIRAKSIRRLAGLGLHESALRDLVRLARARGMMPHLLVRAFVEAGVAARVSDRSARVHAAR
jgi:hypothetical protein